MKKKNIIPVIILWLMHCLHPQMLWISARQRFASKEDVVWFGVGDLIEPVPIYCNALKKRFPSLWIPTAGPKEFREALKLDESGDMWYKIRSHSRIPVSGAKEAVFHARCFYRPEALRIGIALSWPGISGILSWSKVCRRNSSSGSVVGGLCISSLDTSRRAAWEDT